MIAFKETALELTESVSYAFLSGSTFSSVSHFTAMILDRSTSMRLNFSSGLLVVLSRIDVASKLAYVILLSSSLIMMTPSCISSRSVFYTFTFVLTLRCASLAAIIHMWKVTVAMMFTTQMIATCW